MKFSNISSSLLLSLVLVTQQQSSSAFTSTSTPRSSSFITTSTTRSPRHRSSIVLSEATIVPESDGYLQVPKYQVSDVQPQNDEVTSSTRRSGNSANLPLGIKLTGGIKLRNDGLTGKGVKVGVIDSGVDANHVGFNGQVKKQMWFRSGSPLSEDDHGTHVAGTIHMMAPDAIIHDYRVFGAEGWDVGDAIATAIYEACFDGCDILNMSLGGRWPSEKIRGAVKFAYDQGVIVVCAAGNEGDDNALTNERSFPGLWPEALNIAAVAKQNGLPSAYFSNTNPEVDYAGIGVDVISFRPDGGTQKMSGTSMACPHVCGFITALLTKMDDGSISYGDLINDDASLRKVLNEKFLIDIGVKGPDNETGLGFLTYLSKEEFDEMW